MPEVKRLHKALELALTLAAIQVTYFKKRRVMEYQRDQTIKKLNAEGAQPMQTTGK